MPRITVVVSRFYARLPKAKRIAEKKFGGVHPGDKLGCSVCINWRRFTCVDRPLLDRLPDLRSGRIGGGLSRGRSIS